MRVADKTARNNLDETTKIRKTLAALNTTRQTIARLKSISDMTPINKGFRDVASQTISCCQDSLRKSSLQS